MLSICLGASWVGVVRMRAVRESHEGEEGPVIVCCWIYAILNAEPALNFGSSGEI